MDFGVKGCYGHTGSMGHGKTKRFVRSLNPICLIRVFILEVFSLCMCVYLWVWRAVVLAQTEGQGKYQ